MVGHIGGLADLRPETAYSLLGNEVGALLDAEPVGGQRVFRHAGAGSGQQGGEGQRKLGHCHKLGALDDGAVAISGVRRRGGGGR
jgi:hypothetical protein